MKQARLYSGRWCRAHDHLCWHLPLVGIAAILFVNWLWLRRQGVATPTEGRRLLMRVGFVLAFSAGALVTGAFLARRWRLQGIGLFCVLLGTAGLFIRVIGRWGPQPVGEWERDLIQALLNVGSVVQAVGVTVWLGLRVLRRQRVEPPSDAIMGPADDRVLYVGPERRKRDTPGRRTSDRRGNQSP